MGQNAPPLRHLIPARVLRSPEASARGVSSPWDLPPGGGVWFPGAVAITMAHTPIPLDAIVLGQEGVVLSIQTLPAMAPEGFDLRLPGAIGVLEVAAGSAARRMLRVGDFVRLAVISVE